MSRSSEDRSAATKAGRDVEPVELERDRRHRVHAADDRPGHGGSAIIVLRAAPTGGEEIAGEQPVVRFDRGPVLLALPAHADPDDDRLEPGLVQLRDHRPEVRIPSRAARAADALVAPRQASRPRSGGGEARQCRDPLVEERVPSAALGGGR